MSEHLEENFAHGVSKPILHAFSPMRVDTKEQRPPSLPATADVRDGARGNFPLTELGTAMRFVARHGDDVRFVPEREAWMFWQDDRWVWDADGSKVRVLVAQLHSEIYSEGAAAGPESKFHIDWARKCQTDSIIRKIVSLVSDRPEVRLALSSIDSNAYIVGINGARQVIDLRTGQVRSATRQDWVTRSLLADQLGCPAKAKRWHQFLVEIFDGDMEIVNWVQLFLGYALTGAVTEHIFLFAHGLGANGKSVLVNTCMRIWHEYARVVQPETLMKQNRSSAGPSPDLARLAGARLGIVSETEEGQALGESLIKQLTGGDSLTAREMYSRPFEFKPTLKFIVSGNHLPTIKGSDNGIWRRLKVLPFARTFKTHEQDPHLESKLMAEAEDILAWMVEGCRRYFDHGIGETPRAMIAITEDYRHDEDVIGQWMAERTLTSGTSQASRLFGDFRTWSEASGFAQMTPQAFGRRLAERGLSKAHTRSGVQYQGISLRW